MGLDGPQSFVSFLLSFPEDRVIGRVASDTDNPIALWLETAVNLQQPGGPYFSVAVSLDVICLSHYNVVISRVETPMWVREFLGWLRSEDQSGEWVTAGAVSGFVERLA